MEKKILHSETVKGSGSTYFFDLKEAKNGKPYLTIVESRMGQEGNYERTRMMVFSEDFDKFAEALSKTLAQAPEPVPES
jgi:hypothetical protein